MWARNRSDIQAVAVETHRRRVLTVRKKHDRVIYETIGDCGPAVDCDRQKTEREVSEMLKQWVDLRGKSVVQVGPWLIDLKSVTEVLECQQLPLGKFFHVKTAGHDWFIQIEVLHAEYEVFVHQWENRFGRLWRLWLWIKSKLINAR